MSEKTKEVKKFQYTMYTYSLHGETINGTFDNQTMSIGCVGKLGDLFGFLRHYLLILFGLGGQLMSHKILIL